MTQNKNIKLTPEEQEEISENMPQLLEAIEKDHPIAQAWLASWRSKQSLADEAKEQAETVQKEVGAAIEASGPEQITLAQWCGFPTDMTRCSPFFPMHSSLLGHREFLRDFLITSANWGEIRYTGPQLSIYEEDALMALLAVLDDVSQYRHISEVEGQKTSTYKGPALPLLRVLGYSRPGKDAYKRLVASLELLMSAVVKLSISAGKTKSGKKRQPRYIHLSNMLSGVVWNEETKELSATINPFFYEMYLAGRVTLMDVTKRMALKGLNAKALYRFVQSQRQNPVFVGHFLTLADALNMDREQPTKKIKQLLKMAINELIRQGILAKKSGFVNTDIIRLERASEALPNAEKKKRITT